MRSRELQQELARTFRGRSASDIDQRLRVLREFFRKTAGEAGMASGARGLAAPHLTLEEVAAHVLALVSRRPGDFPEVFSTMSDCGYVPHPLFEDVPASGQGPLQSLVPGMSIVAAISLAVRSHQPGWKNFEISEDGDVAWLTIREGSPLGFRVMFSVDHETVARRVTELAASVGDGPEWSRKLLAYEERDRQTRGSRFVVNATDLFWMGLRAIKSNPDLAAEFEAEAEEGLKG